MYKLTPTWPQHIESGAFVNPESNQEYLKWLNGYTEIIRAPAIWVPEVPATLDDGGHELTAASPGYWTEGEVLETIEQPPHTPEPYVPPPTPIPTSLTMKQARLALHFAGYLAAVEAGVATMERPAKIIWEFASTVERTDPLVIALSASLNLSSEDLDSLFTLGSTF